MSLRIRYFIFATLTAIIWSCCDVRSSQALVDTSLDTVLRFQEYVLAQTGKGSLHAVVELHQRMDGNEILDTFVCKFYRVSAAGIYRLVARANSYEGGDSSDNWTQADDFLGNGRKQVLVATWTNDTHGRVFDFDGERVSTIYNSDNYNGEVFAGRTYLGCLHTATGQAVIQEAFHQPNNRHPTAEEQKQGFIYVKEQCCLLRVVCWRSGKWRPVKFRYNAKEQRAVVP